MSYAYVRTERTGDVGLIVLSDVSGKNALRPQTMAALPHRAYALAKEVLHQGLGSTIEREWPAAIAAQATLLASPDFQAAVQRIPSKTADPVASSGGRAPTPADPLTQKGSHE
jgi:enoyl-CoA hydratase/carnithine racemase